MMAPRSRHAAFQPPSNFSNTKGSKSQIPRHHSRHETQDCSFSHASLPAGLDNHSFSLSSLHPRFRYQSSDTSQWTMRPNSFPRGDNLMPMTGFNASSLNGPAFSMPVMNGLDSADHTYNPATSQAYSRHALFNVNIPQQGQLMEFGPSLANDYPELDFSQFTSLDTWPDRGFTPPPEALLEASFPCAGLPMDDGFYNDTSSISQDTIVCENLGPSKLLPFSGSRHSNLKPRPIKSASEKRMAPSPSNEELDFRSPVEDHIDKVTARDNPLYNAKPGKDGLYHCPLMAEYKCSHKPTKQKCIYAKYLDSHLRPYKCKYATPGSDCEETRFSSNACLFRHEREAHGMHNHGVNPFHCVFQGCDRAKLGNGFPRRWNQRDHMKRVHGWNEEELSPSSSDRNAPIDSSTKKRGSGGPTSVRMRRSSSSYAKAQAATAAYTKESRHGETASRHRIQAAFVDPMQTCNVTGYSVPMDDVQFSQTSVSRISRHSQDYSGNYYQAVY